jgi:hypothetical protein
VSPSLLLSFTIVKLLTCQLFELARHGCRNVISLRHGGVAMQMMFL